jgi:hypothetical protein
MPSMLTAAAATSPRVIPDEADVRACANCGGQGPGLKLCGACRGARYCNEKCVSEHWPTHRGRCKVLQLRVVPVGLIRRFAPIAMTPLAEIDSADCTDGPADSDDDTDGVVVVGFEATARPAKVFTATELATMQTVLRAALDARLRIPEPTKLIMVVNYADWNVAAKHDPLLVAREIFARASRLNMTIEALI